MKLLKKMIKTMPAIIKNLVLFTQQECTENIELRRLARGVLTMLRRNMLST